MLEYVNSNTSIFQSLKTMWKERCEKRDYLLEPQQSKHIFEQKHFKSFKTFCIGRGPNDVSGYAAVNLRRH